MDPTAARHRLEELLEELDRATRTLEGEAGDTGALSRVAQHPAEAASDLTEQERDDAMLAVAAEQRQQVLAALSRLDAGSYGRCMDCGTELSEERLEARPEAARCLNCQHELERAS